MIRYLDAARVLNRYLAIMRGVCIALRLPGLCQRGKLRSDSTSASIGSGTEFRVASKTRRIVRTEQRLISGDARTASQRSARRCEDVPRASGTSDACS